MNDRSEEPRRIALIEPWFTTGGHMTFNRAFVAVIREAFPAAEISFACSSTYSSEFVGSSRARHHVDHFVEATAWPLSSTNGDFVEFWHRTRWLVGIFRQFRYRGIEPTQIVILGASGPTLIATGVAKALYLRSGCEVYAIVHGAYEILHGWRPRNPLRIIFTFRFAMKWLRFLGIRVIALESFIAEKLRAIYPRQARRILCIPHGYDESEVLPRRATTKKTGELNVLFLGQATPHKGFLDFVQLANLARDTRSTSIQFRAAGAVRRDTQDVDQSSLLKPAVKSPLKRREMLDELACTDLVFTWQTDYYELTPSGILLDCIGLQVPLTGRRSLAIVEIESRYGACGLFADDIASLFSRLVEFSNSQDRCRLLEEWRENLRNARFDRSARTLGPVARCELQ